MNNPLAEGAYSVGMRDRDEGRAFRASVEDWWPEVADVAYADGWAAAVSHAR